MYLVFPKVLEIKEVGANIVGARRQGHRPEILLSPKEVLALMYKENGREYTQRLLYVGTDDQTLFGRYQPIERGIQLSRNMRNLKEWSY